MIHERIHPRGAEPAMREGEASDRELRRDVRAKCVPRCRRARKSETESLGNILRDQLGEKRVDDEAAASPWDDSIGPGETRGRPTCPA
jgi:hypothetical protein